MSVTKGNPTQTLVQVFECITPMQDFTKGNHYAGMVFDDEEGVEVIGFAYNDAAKSHVQRYTPYKFFSEVTVDEDVAVHLELIEEQAFADDLPF